jgi:hypothetical protein
MGPGGDDPPATKIAQKSVAVLAITAPESDPFWSACAYTRVRICTKTIAGNDVVTGRSIAQAADKTHWAVSRQYICF